MKRILQWISGIVVLTATAFGQLTDPVAVYDFSDQRSLGVNFYMSRPGEHAKLQGANVTIIGRAHNKQSFMTTWPRWKPYQTGWILTTEIGTMDAFLWQAPIDGIINVTLHPPKWVQLGWLPIDNAGPAVGSIQIEKADTITAWTRSALLVQETSDNPWLNPPQLQPVPTISALFAEEFNWNLPDLSNTNVLYEEIFTAKFWEPEPFTSTEGPKQTRLRVQAGKTYSITVKLPEPLQSTKISAVTTTAGYTITLAYETPEIVQKSKLQEVASLDPQNTHIEQMVEPGYYYLVQHGNPAEGNIKWTFSSVPANDNFADAIDLNQWDTIIYGNGRGFTQQASYKVAGATLEAGEPPIAEEASVWFRFIAPASGALTITPNNQAYIYTGGTLSNVTRVGAGNQKISVLVSQGTMYHIQVATAKNNSLGSSTLKLSLLENPWNDSFASAIQVLSNAYTSTQINGETRYLFEFEAPVGFWPAIKAANTVYYLRNWYRIEAPDLVDVWAYGWDQEGNPITTAGNHSFYEPPCFGNSMFNPTDPYATTINVGCTGNPTISPIWGKTIFELNIPAMRETFGFPNVAQDPRYSGLFNFTAFPTGPNISYLYATPRNLAWPIVNTNVVNSQYKAVLGYSRMKYVFVSKSTAPIKLTPVLPVGLSSAGATVNVTTQPLTTSQQVYDTLSTLESGEPSKAGSGGGSVWWKMKAPYTGFLTVREASSTYTPLISIWAGTNLSTLTPINNNYQQGKLSSSLVTAVEAGQDIQISIDRISNGELFDLEFSLSDQPYNTTPANALQITPDLVRAFENGTNWTYNLAYTIYPTNATFPNNDVWFRLNSPAVGMLAADTNGTKLRIYEEHGVNTLHLSPPGKTFIGQLELQVLHAPETPLVYYTTDGSTPTTNSAIYTTPFTISNTCTVMAAILQPGRTPAIITEHYVAIPGIIANTPATNNTDKFALTLTNPDPANSTMIYRTEGDTWKPYTQPVDIDGLGTGEGYVYFTRVNSDGTTNPLQYLQLTFQCPTPQPATPSPLEITMAMTNVSILITNVLSGASVGYSRDGYNWTPLTETAGVWQHLLEVNSLTSPQTTFTYRMTKNGYKDSEKYPLQVNLTLPAPQLNATQVNLASTATQGILYVTNAPDGTSVKVRREAGNWQAMEKTTNGWQHAFTPEQVAGNEGVTSAQFQYVINRTGFPDSPTSSAQVTLLPTCKILPEQANVLIGENLQVEIGPGNIPASLLANWSPTYYYTLDGTIPTPSSTLYQGPFTVSNTVTVRAGMWVAGNPTYAAHTFNFQAPITVNTPANPLYAPYTMALTNPDTNSTIIYRVGNGNWTTYTEPVTFDGVANGNEAIYFTRYVEGRTNPIQNIYLNFVLPTPSVTPSELTLPVNQNNVVAWITNVPSGATISVQSPVQETWQTLVQESNQWKHVITPRQVSEAGSTALFRYRANRQGYNPSESTNLVVSLQNVCTISPQTRNHSREYPINVSIGADVQPLNWTPRIYFTTDGTEPTTNSTVYSNPITINDSTTVRALMQNGPLTPAQASASYVFHTPIGINIPANGSYTNPVDVVLTSSLPVYYQIASVTTNQWFTNVPYSYTQGTKVFNTTIVVFTNMVSTNITPWQLYTAPVHIDGLGTGYGWINYGWSSEDLPSSNQTAYLTFYVPWDMTLEQADITIPYTIPGTNVTVTRNNPLYTPKIWSSRPSLSYVMYDGVLPTDVIGKMDSFAEPMTASGNKFDYFITGESISNTNESKTKFLTITGTRPGYQHSPGVQVAITAQEIPRPAISFVRQSGSPTEDSDVLITTPGFEFPNASVQFTRYLRYVETNIANTIPEGNRDRVLIEGRDQSLYDPLANMAVKGTNPDPETAYIYDTTPPKTYTWDYWANPENNYKVEIRQITIYPDPGLPQWQQKVPLRNGYQWDQTPITVMLDTNLPIIAMKWGDYGHATVVKDVFGRKVETKKHATYVTTQPNAGIFWKIPVPEVQGTNVIPKVRLGTLSGNYTNYGYLTTYNWTYGIYAQAYQYEQWWNVAQGYAIMLRTDPYTSLSISPSAIASTSDHYATSPLTGDMVYTHTTVSGVPFGENSLLWAPYNSLSGSLDVYQWRLVEIYADNGQKVQWKVRDAGRISDYYQGWYNPYDLRRWRQTPYDEKIQPDPYIQWDARAVRKGADMVQKARWSTLWGGPWALPAHIKDSDPF